MQLSLPDGMALLLDGTNDYARAADSASLDLGVGFNDDFTIESMFYVSNPNDTALLTLASKSGSYALSIQFGAGANDIIRFQLSYGGVIPGGGTFIETKMLSLGSRDIGVGWHHIAVTFDDKYSPTADLISFYLDGQRIASSPQSINGSSDLPPLVNSTSDLRVGSASDTNDFGGYLEELRLWSGLRYNAATYAVPSNPFTTDPSTRGLWHFDEARGSTTFADASGNQNTLTGLNGAQTGDLPGSATPPGSETRVNSRTAGEQATQSVAMDANGNSLVVWRGPGAQGAGDTDIFGQRFDAAGNKVGREFRVNTTTSGIQAEPVVAMNASGASIVAWGGATGFDKIYARRYDAAGNPLGNDFIISTSPQRGAYVDVAIAASGQSVITWSSQDDTGVWQVHAQRLDASGNKVGGDFIVNEVLTDAHHTAPQVTILPSGEVLIAWVNRDGYNAFNIKGRRFRADGTPSSSTFPISAGPPANNHLDSMATDVNGSTVLTWHEDLGRVHYVKIDAAGNLGVERLAGDKVTDSSVAADDAGNFVITFTPWRELAMDGSGKSVFAQRFDTQGLPVGNPFRVNTTTSGDQEAYYLGAVASDRLGNIVVTWSGNGPGDTSGIFAQRFARANSSSSAAPATAALAARSTSRLGSQTNAGTSDIPLVGTNAGHGKVVSARPRISVPNGPRGLGSAIQRRVLGQMSLNGPLRAEPSTIGRLTHRPPRPAVTISR